MLYSKDKNNMKKPSFIKPLKLMQIYLTKVESILLRISIPKFPNKQWL